MRGQFVLNKCANYCIAICYYANITIHLLIQPVHIVFKITFTKDKINNVGGLALAWIIHTIS